MRYRLEVRLTAADVGSRVVIRWRRPASAGNGAGVGGGSGVGGGGVGGSGEGGGLGAGDPGAAGGPNDEIADVLGILEAADDASFSVRKASGDLVTIPRQRALAGKTVPPQARRGRPVLPR